MIDQQILDAAIRVVTHHDWEGMTLERVATEAGASRSTLWRQGITRETLIQALLGRLSESYRTAVWPALTSSGTGRERLEQALHSLCDVVDANLPLLSATDTAFHVASSSELLAPTPFVGPIERLIRDGIADGTLINTTPPGELATVVFNAVCWTYAHLRARHRWSSERGRECLLPLIVSGLASPASAAL